MQEIGGHFIFERFDDNQYHDTNLLLSSGRNCLRYIIQKRNIKTIHLPYFLCETLEDICRKENVEIKFYFIDKDFSPLISKDNLRENEFVYIVNFYGMIPPSKLKELESTFKNVIIDSTHDFFDKTKFDADIIYNYRKYFGVPDGACIISDLKLDNSYPKSDSSKKVEELILREEKDMFQHYDTFQEADRFFSGEDICLMSDFTRNYLSAINYDKAKTKRESNFRCLQAELEKYNKMDLSSTCLNYMYPLYVDNGEELRKFLKENNVYSLMLWPNVLGNGASDVEVEYVKNIVLLPIDQRYGSNEMQYISDLINSFYKKDKGYSLSRKMRGIDYVK